MKLFTTCDSCREEIKIKSSASDRSELERERKERFEVICPNCAAKQEKHVNDVRARENKNFIIGGAVIGLIVTAVLWMMLGAIGTLGIIIPILIWQQQSAAVGAFNRYLLSR